MNATDCIFCKIVSGEIPSKIIYEDDYCMAFYDISPAAPKHALVIPKAHSDDIRELDDEAALGRLMRAAVITASKLDMDRDGFRLVVNTGKDGGQAVPHLHVHVLGGRPLAWPPG